MTNNNESYYTDQYFNNFFKCNRNNSFSNFYQPYNNCDTHYFDAITGSLKTDGNSKDFMNIAYGLLLSYNSYLNRNCSASSSKTNTSELIHCLKIARDATIIRPYLQNIVLPIDFRNNQNSKLFNNNIGQNSTTPNCDGFTVKYTIDIALVFDGILSYEK